MNRAQRRRQGRIPDAAPARAATPLDLAYRRGAEAASAGNLAEAERHYEVCLTLDAHHVDAIHDLGVVALRAGRAADAAEHLGRATAIRPSHAGAWMNLALAFCDLGDAAAAADAASRAVAIAPGSGAAQASLGHALSLAEDLAGADAAYRRSLDCDRDAPSVLARHAALLRRLGRLDQSLATYDRLSALRPRNLATRLGRLCLLVALGSDREVEEEKRAVAALAASDRPGLQQLCANLVEEGRPADAMLLADVAVAGNPGAADILATRAALLYEAGRMAETLADLRRALSLDPANTDVLFSIGRLFAQFDQPAAAAPFFLEVIEHKPDSADAYVHLANARVACGDAAGGSAFLRHALALAPESLWIGSDLCWSRLTACDWDGLEAEFRRNLERHLAAGQPVAPFTLLAFGLTGEEMLLWTRAWAERKIGPAMAPMSRYALAGDAPRRDRIRVGYLSADYKDHATVLLITELLEAHDSRRFETFGYNIGAIDESARCRRVIRALDHFVDLVSLKDAQAARRIAADGIDILIDLKGYTKDGRPEILAHRPAPIQVNYLGYPGSMGSAAVDYIIADAVVVPDDHRGFYDEAVIRLPNSYQPNDRSRAGADPSASRARHGLPEKGFVFCCFNSSYKISPLFFGIWMRLLSATPGSVLWLLSINNQVEDNLRRAARRCGIASDRVIFAPRAAFEDHVGRLGLADLFLDTLPVGAHTTASEALWAGLPVLTCLGPHFIGRVAASLLDAVGLPELITASLVDYEREALALAHDPARLGALRDRLAANRLTAPLFDTPRYVKNYEAALERMMEIRAAGERPRAFEIRDRG